MQFHRDILVKFEENKIIDFSCPKKTNNLILETCEKYFLVRGENAPP